MVVAFVLRETAVGRRVSLWDARGGGDGVRGVFGGEYVYEWRVDRAVLCMCEWFMSYDWISVKLCCVTLRMMCKRMVRADL